MIASAGTIRSRLYVIVLMAMLPLVFIGIWQGTLAYRDSAELVANRLRAGTWAIADESRAPFVFASQSLQLAAENPIVRGVTPRCNETLAKASELTKGTVNIVRTDATGVVRCSGLPFTFTRFDSHEWWRTARATGRPVLGRPQIGEISRIPVVVMAYPIRNASGAFDGTISAGISLSNLEQVVENGSKGRPGRTLIVDSLGRTILSSGDGSQIHLHDPKKAAFNVQEAKADDGETWIYVAAPLFDSSVYIVYAERRSDFAARTLLRTWVVLALPFLTALLVVLALWIGTRRILQWFLPLQNLAHRISLGDFTVNERSFDAAPLEFASLAADLRDMAREIEEHEEQLKTSMDARMRLTREVNHRVRNNLQIVISLLSLQARRARTEWEREVLGQMRARLGTLALIQRIAYEGEGGTEGRVNVATLLDQICLQARTNDRNDGRVELVCQHEDLMLSIDHAMPLMLFAIEAMSNAYRHAFVPGGSGQIKVSLSSSDGMGHLSVQDDGRGFIEAEGVGNVGMELMQAFADQLRGKMEISTSETGVRISVRFPLD